MSTLQVDDGCDATEGSRNISTSKSKTHSYRAYILGDVERVRYFRPLVFVYHMLHSAVLLHFFVQQRQVQLQPAELQVRHVITADKCKALDLW